MVKPQARITPKPRRIYRFKTKHEGHSNLKVGRSLFFLSVYFSVTSALASFQSASASHLPDFFTSRMGKSLLLTTEYWSSQVKSLARNWALWKMTHAGRLPTTSQEWGTVPWLGVCVSPDQEPCQEYAHWLHSRPSQTQRSELQESRSYACIFLALDKM